MSEAGHRHRHSPHSDTYMNTYARQGKGKGSWQPIRQVSAPLETDLVWATYGPCLASFMANSLGRECGGVVIVLVDTFGAGKSFLISPGCSLVTKIVELAKAPLGQSDNSNNCRERNWKRACSMRHFSLKVSLFVVPQQASLSADKSYLDNRLSRGGAGGEECK